MFRLHPYRSSCRISMRQGIALLSIFLIIAPVFAQECFDYTHSDISRGSVALDGFAVDFDVSDGMGCLACRNGTLYSIDLSDPFAPSLGSSLDSGLSVNMMMMHDGLAYFACEDSGLVIASIDDPGTGPVIQERFLSSETITAVGRQNDLVVAIAGSGSISLFSRQPDGTHDLVDNITVESNYFAKVLDVGGDILVATNRYNQLHIYRIRCTDQSITILNALESSARAGEFEAIAYDDETALFIFANTDLYESLYMEQFAISITDNGELLHGDITPSKFNGSLLHLSGSLWLYHESWTLSVYEWPSLDSMTLLASYFVKGRQVRKLCRDGNALFAVEYSGWMEATFGSFDLARVHERMIVDQSPPLSCPLGGGAYYDTVHMDSYIHSMSGGRVVYYERGRYFDDGGDWYRTDSVYRRMGTDGSFNDGSLELCGARFLSLGESLLEGTRGGERLLFDLETGDLVYAAPGWSLDKRIWVGDILLTFPSSGNILAEDLSDPANPVVAWDLPAAFPYYQTEVVHEGYLYIFAELSDVDPNVEIWRLNGTDPPDLALSTSLDFTNHGQLSAMIIGDAIAVITPNFNPTITFINVDDPLAPYSLGTVSDPYFQTPRAIEGNLLVNADGNQVSIYDIGSPLEPRWIGGFWHGYGVDDIGLSDGYIIVTSKEERFLTSYRIPSSVPLPVEDPVSDDPPAFSTTSLVCQPNPFNPTTVIRHLMDLPGEVEISIHDASGARVRILYSGTLTAGWHDIPWDGRNNQGRAVASGTYLVKVTTEGRSRFTKATLIK